MPRPTVLALGALLAVALHALALGPHVAQGEVWVDLWHDGEETCEDPDAPVVLVLPDRTTAALLLESDCGDVPTDWTCADDPSYEGRIRCVAQDAADEGELVYDPGGRWLSGMYARYPGVDGNTSVLTFSGILDRSAEALAPAGP